MSLSSFSLEGKIAIVTGLGVESGNGAITNIERRRQ